MSALGSAFFESLPRDVRVLERLGGHSGAEVLLCEHGADNFVRKTAAGSGTNPRLRKQAIKQRLFAAQGFPLPAVRSIGKDDNGRAFFDMDYVPSRTLAELVVSGAVFDRTGIVEAVAQILWIFRSCVAGTLAADTFLTKISDVTRSTEKNSAAAGHRDAITDLSRQLAERDWSNIPASPGHGDLTLENILVSPGQGVMFIDCDEPFASSYWLDFAKLFQDFDGHWCLREDAGDAASAASELAVLGREFRALAKDANPKLPGRLSQLAALHLFRALGYAQSTQTVDFVCRATARVLAAA
jgi:aminoglycoside phosphotransferase (APT) family kinase protein